MLQKIFVLLLLFPIFIANAGGYSEVKIDKEKKFKNLLGKGKYEASGVVHALGKLHVVFDNMRSTARIEKLKKRKSELIASVKSKEGYEGITFDKTNNRFLLLIETVKVGNQVKAELHEYNNDLKFINSKILDYNFKNKDGELIWKKPDNANTGFEGITTYQTADNQILLLALCEGNKCLHGKKSKENGNGRIQVFSEGIADWNHLYTIHLPKEADWTDYSGIDIFENNIAVVSQESAKLWIGKITLKNKKLHIQDNGKKYKFPKGYCNVEGVTFINKNKIAIVSDKTKKDKQPKKCKKKDQSIHLLEL